MKNPVYFIGTGPGDPELLTVKARRLIRQADVIVYADSLINPAVLKLAKTGADILKSAGMTLEETHHILSSAVKAHKKVVRLQSGDPAIYGAIREQMSLLTAEGLEYDVVPGVSSLFASAAALKKELTVPGFSQTIIITRLEGHTPVPSREKLSALASHRATLAIFLSVAMIEKVAAELLAEAIPPQPRQQ
jgi:precorrin-4/cobalt-precorrin-4 C11-methyltransferase